MRDVDHRASWFALGMILGIVLMAAIGPSISAFAPTTPADAYALYQRLLTEEGKRHDAAMGEQK